MDQTPAAMDRHLEVIQCHPGKLISLIFYLSSRVFLFITDVNMAHGYFTGPGCN